MKFTLTFATRYNGVYCTPNEDIADEALLEQVEKVCDDEISMVFPEYTYEMCDKFDHALTSKQIDELCEKAAVILRPLIPDVEVGFEYDEYSS